MKKAAVGLSGGVDSAVTAYLLKNQGYEVIGVTLKLNEKEQDDSINDARNIAQYLGIDFAVSDYSEKFRHEVSEYFVSEYIAGRTPNPCCRCNRMVKFAALRDFASQNDIEYIATGHYAQIIKLPNGRFTVQKALCDSKDQTYALYNLTQNEIEKTLMPLGDYTKEKIRSIAQEAGLPVADKKDSQDICFIPDGDYAAYLRAFVRNNPECGFSLPSKGRFIDENGAILGEHTGYTDYTIGQRKGLNVAAGHRVYVKNINPSRNEVILSDEDVYSSSLTADEINMMGIETIDTPVRMYAKIRYAHKGEWCIVTPQNDGTLSCEFEKNVRAVTPGQAVVFYSDDSSQRYILCGGTII